MNEKNNETRNERKTLPFSWEYGQEEITLKVLPAMLMETGLRF